MRGRPGRGRTDGSPVTADQLQSNPSDSFITDLHHYGTSFRTTWVTTHTGTAPFDATAVDVVTMPSGTMTDTSSTAAIRANRLALLQTLLKEFSTIADFSEIVTEGKA